MILRMKKAASRMPFVFGVLPGETAFTVTPAGSLRASSAAHQATNSLAVAYTSHRLYSAGASIRIWA